MPKLWTEVKSANGYLYQNPNSGELVQMKNIPEENWAESSNESNPGSVYYYNPKLGSQYNLPANVRRRGPNDPSLLGIGTVTSGEHFSGRKGSNASTISAASSTTMASNAEAQRIRNLEAQVEALKRQLAATTVAPVAATVAPVANNAYSKYRKMLKMGVPRPAVNQKMRANGLDPAVLNGAAPTAAVPAAAAAAPRPGGPPAFLAGIAGATLKKTTGPAATTVKNNKKPVTGAQAVQQGLAAAAAAKRAEMGSVNIEARLAAAKAAKKNVGAPTGFAKFQAELAAKAAAKAAKEAAPPQPKQSTSNAQGPLPTGWYYMNDGPDQWYSHVNGRSQWNRPKSRKNRKTRRNRSSRRRRN